MHRVRSEGLLAEDMFLRFHRGFKMHRPVCGWCGKHHDVHIGGDQFLIRVETDEAMLHVHLEAAGHFRRQGLRLPDALLHAGLRDVGERDDLDVITTGENVLNAAVPRLPLPISPDLNFALPAPRTSSGRMI